MWHLALDRIDRTVGHSEAMPVRDWALRWHYAVHLEASVTFGILSVEPVLWDKKGQPNHFLLSHEFLGRLGPRWKFVFATFLTSFAGICDG